MHKFDAIERLTRVISILQESTPEDTHYVCLRRESNPGRLSHWRAHYLKSYLDSLNADYSEPLQCSICDAGVAGIHRNVAAPFTAHLIRKLSAYGVNIRVSLV